MWNWLSRFLYGPPPAVSSPAPPGRPIPPPGRTSLAFESHVAPYDGITFFQEARGGNSSPQALSLAWDEGRAWGQNLAPQSWLGMTPRERKETLLSIFLANPWASNCIETIALYIVSGGYAIEPRVPKPQKSRRAQIEKFLLRINEDWDFNQWTFDMLTDEMIFGEGFSEFTLRDRKPYQLFAIDCLTMETEHDQYGRATAYKQQLTYTSEMNYLDPKTIIRWWNPHKRAKVDPFSPLERIQDAILLDKKMINWLTTFFQKGAKFPFSIEGISDQDEADRFLTWFMANYMGEKNAQKPFVGWGGAKVVPFGKGSIDMDFDKGLDRMLTIVLSAFHVPPSIACIAESGNRLTDMSDGQRKILQYIACDPRRHRFFEKFNYRLIFPFFGEDYYVSSRYADFRDDESLAKVADLRVKNGTMTQNEVRQEMGRKPYQRGGDIPVIVTNKEVTPVPRLEDLEDEQRDKAQAELDQAQANAEMAKTKAKQAKEPPEPVPPSPGNNGANPGDTTKNTENLANDSVKSGRNSTQSIPRQDNEDEDTQPKKRTKGPARGAQSKGADAKESIGAPGSFRQQKATHESEGEKRAQEQSGEARAPHIKGSTTVEGGRGAQYATESSQGAGRQTGMMLAFLLDSEVAKQVVIPGGERAEELHITLAYLGDMEDEGPEDDLYRPHRMPEPIKRVLAAVTSAAQPLIGKVGGVGRFTSQPDKDTPTPVIATVDVPGLSELRTEIVDALVQANYFVADTHGYTPHITLAYIDAEAPMPVETVPPVSLLLNTVTLCVGEERFSFRLGGDPLLPAGESHEEQKAEAAVQGDATAAPAENAVAGSADLPLSTDRATTEAQDEATAQKAALAAWITALFIAVKERGALASPDLTSALAAYALTDQDRKSLAHKLAEVNLAAQLFAYQRDLAAVGLQAKSDLFVEPLSWSQDQVESIASTMQEHLGNFLAWLTPDADVPTEIGTWLYRYSAYKAPQIANVAWGTGANDGSMAAIEGMLDAATDPDQMGMIQTDNIRIRVVPAESSSDFCKDYAGQDYSIEEYLGLGMRWPAHPGCPHHIEAYLDTGDGDGSESMGDEEL